MFKRSVSISVAGCFLLAAASASAMCRKDTDCKGDRICENGKCVYPGAASTTPPTVAPAPQPVYQPAPQPVVQPAPQPAVQPAPQPAPQHGVKPAPQPAPQPAPLDPKIAAAIEANPALAEALMLEENARAAGAPVDKAKAGIVIGTVFDVTGYALFIGSMIPLALDDLGTAMILQYSGSGVAVIGSVIGSASYTARHSAYIKAGFLPGGGRKAAAWTLTSLSIGLFGAGMGLGIASGGDDFGLAIGSIVANGLALILEAINFMVRGKWNVKLHKSAAQPGVARLKPVVIPMVNAAFNPETGRSTPVFGIAGAF